jgi:hypothetical protein
MAYKYYELQRQLQNTFFHNGHLKELKTMKKKKLRISCNKQTKLPWQGTIMEVQYQTSSSLLEMWL